MNEKDQLRLGASMPVRTQGRPPLNGHTAMTPAEKQKRYRERRKQLESDRRNPSVPLSSKIIDLSVLPAWQRR